MKMYDGLNKMLTGDYLLHKMSIYPEYNHLYIKKFDPCIRLNELSKIYDIYVPTKMTIEIYVQLYLSLIKSLNKKCTMAAQKQRYCSLQNGVIGGADSFTILGDSGIGKSTAINVAIKQIINSQIIEIQHPYSKVIPFLTVQCPYDSSVRSMLLEILRQIDEIFKTDNYSHAIKQRLTIDVLIGKVAQLCLNHIGVLIIDEIQNIAISKNGKMLIRSLTQLINNSGVSICMVGISECEDFFTQEMYLARRCTGLKYNKLSYENFKEICCVIWKYQFTTNITELNKDIIDWLYYYTDGIVAILIQLVHDSQEFCIINNIESLTINILDKVYSERFSFIKPHINNEYIINFNKNKMRKKEIENTNDTKYKDNILELLLQESKNKNKDMISLLKTVCKVEEIKI